MAMDELTTRERSDWQEGMCKARCRPAAREPVVEGKKSEAAANVELGRESV